MERTEKITAVDIPTKLLHAPHLPWLGAILLGKPIANDNFDDDPPPAASAPVTTLPARRDDEEDCQTLRPGARAYIPELLEHHASETMYKCSERLLSSVSPSRRLWK